MDKGHARHARQVDWLGGVFGQHQRGHGQMPAMFGRVLVAVRPRQIGAAQDVLQPVDLDQEIDLLAQPVVVDERLLHTLLPHKSLDYTPARWRLK